MVDGESARVWLVGDEVTVKDYDGNITAVNADGTYALTYAEGGGIADVDRGMLMPRESIAESRMRRRRPAHHRKQDKEAAIDYDTRKTESLQNAARAKTVTFGLLCKPLEAASEGGAASEGTRAVAVQVLTDVPADGSLRLVPAPNGNPLRDREYIRVEDILGGTLADEKPRRKQEYFDSYSCLDWQATMHAEEKKRVRIARAATPS